MSKAVKEILLCHHFVPVPVHLLPQVGILALLQLDQSCDLLTNKRESFRHGITPIPPGLSVPSSLVCDGHAMAPSLGTCQHDGEGRT